MISQSSWSRRPNTRRLTLRTESVVYVTKDLEMGDGAAEATDRRLAARTLAAPAAPVKGAAPRRASWKRFQAPSGEA
jgi:hypothetical protein